MPIIHLPLMYLIVIQLLIVSHTLLRGRYQNGKSKFLKSALLLDKRATIRRIVPTLAQRIFFKFPIPDIPDNSGCISIFHNHLIN
jgi:hypothetical protein